MPKYRIKTPRYIDGVYYAATPEAPAVVELAEGTKLDKGLEALDDAGQPTKLKPHFAARVTHPHAHARDVKTDMVVLGAGRDVGTPVGATVVTAAYLGKQEEMDEVLEAQQADLSPEPLTAEERERQYRGKEHLLQDADAVAPTKAGRHATKKRSSDNDAL